MGPVGRSAAAVVCVLLTAVTACGPESGAPAEDSPTPASHADSGVRGVILLSPSCGGARRCRDRPVMRTITALEVGGRGTAGITTSGADGRFEQSLPPGRFRLRTNTPKACPVTLVTVRSERFSRVRIICESGLV